MSDLDFVALLKAGPFQLQVKDNYAAWDVRLVDSIDARGVVLGSA